MVKCDTGQRLGQVRPRFDLDALALKGSRLVAVGNLKVADIDLGRADICNGRTAAIDKNIADTPADKAQCDHAQENLGRPRGRAFAHLSQHACTDLNGVGKRRAS